MAAGWAASAAGMGAGIQEPTSLGHGALQGPAEAVTLQGAHVAAGAGGDAWGRQVVDAVGNVAASCVLPPSTGGEQSKVLLGPWHP